MPKHEMTEWEVAFIVALREHVNEPRVVSKRDGATCTYRFTDIPPTTAACFPCDGSDEYLRDSSSAALANAFDVAHPDHKHEGAKLKEARNAWVVGNVDAMASESTALMEAARDRLYSGERRIATQSSVDPMDGWRIRVLRAKMRTAEGAKLKSMHDAIDSADQADRRAFLLDVAAKNDWVESDAADLRATSEAATAKLRESNIAVAL